MINLFDLYRALDLRLGGGVGHRQIIVTKAQTTDDLVLRFEASTTSNGDEPVRTFVEEVSERQVRDEPDMNALGVRLGDKMLADLHSGKAPEDITFNLVDHPNKKRRLPDGKPMSKAESDELDKRRAGMEEGTELDQEKDPEKVRLIQEENERRKTLPLGQQPSSSAGPVKIEQLDERERRLAREREDKERIDREAQERKDRETVKA